MNDIGLDKVELAMANRTAVRALRTLSKDEILSQLQNDPALAANVSAAARRWGCSRATARQRIAEWVEGKAVATGDPEAATLAALTEGAVSSSAQVVPPAPPVAEMSPPPPRPDRFGPTVISAYGAAVALAGAAAYFSISGMTVLFPGAPIAIIVMASAMEAAKLITVAWLARQWRSTSWSFRAVLVTLVTGLAAINAAGVYSQLVAAHLGDRPAITASAEASAVSLDARIEVQAASIADLDNRLRQIDAVISEMTRRGNTVRALEAIGAQRKTREALVGERQREANALAGLKSQQAAAAAQVRAVEIEAAPIRYVAALFGGTPEQGIRLLILLMVLTCDPLAIALTAAASAVANVAGTVRG
jgi:hypothetical protein